MVSDELALNCLTQRKDPLATAACNDLLLGTEDFRSEERERQIDLLLQVLSDHCIMNILELEADALDTMEPGQILHLFQLKARSKGWTAANIAQF